MAADAEVTPPTPATGPGEPGEEQDLAPRPRRDALTALEIRAAVRELQTLVGGFLEKAYQPAKREVLLRFRAPEVGRRDLFVKPGSFLCFTERPPEMPVTPPGFSMAVRKHAGGGRVFRVEQAGFDRVVTVWVQKKEGDLRIVFELFGDGNCILVRPDGRILVPLHQEAWAARTIKAGQPYQTPPAREDPMGFDEATFIAKARQGNRDVVRALALDAVLGGPVAEEVCARAGLDKTTDAASLGDDDWARLFAAWDGLRQEVEEGRGEAALLLDEGRPIDWTAYRSAALELEVERSNGRLSLRPVPSLSVALDTVFLAGRKARQVGEEVKHVETKLTKLERQRQAQVDASAKFAREVVEKAAAGELLFAHYQTVERIRQTLLAARRDHDWKEIQARIEAAKKTGNPEAQAVEKIDPQSGRVTLRLLDAEGKSQTVQIDISKTVTENAQAAYDRSKTARDKLAGAKVALADTQARMAVAEEEKGEREAAVEDAMQRERFVVAANRHHWFEAFRWFHASTGEIVVGGRDAAGNDRVVKKHLEEGDRYVHADIHGAPSVVVKPVDAATPPTETSLREAAQMAVTYSRAFGQSGSADAYWVTPPQVSKTPQAGEFLSRGAFIVRGERNYLRKLPLVASVGLVWLDRDGRPSDAPADPADAGGLRPKLMGGPPEAVHLRAAQWVDVEAGNEKRAAVVKRLARAFGAHPDAVDRALPVGDLRITSSKSVRLEEAEA